MSRAILLCLAAVALCLLAAPAQAGSSAAAVLSKIVSTPAAAPLPSSGSSGNSTDADEDHGDSAQIKNHGHVTVVSNANVLHKTNVVRHVEPSIEEGYHRILLAQQHAQHMEELAAEARRQALQHEVQHQMDVMRETIHQQEQEILHQQELMNLHAEQQQAFAQHATLMNMHAHELLQNHQLATDQQMHWLHEMHNQQLQDYQQHLDLAAHFLNNLHHATPNHLVTQVDHDIGTSSHNVLVPVGSSTNVMTHPSH